LKEAVVTDALIRHEITARNISWLCAIGIQYIVERSVKTRLLTWHNSTDQK
jgi:hypothetical protein